MSRTAAIVGAIMLGSWIACASGQTPSGAVSGKIVGSPPPTLVYLDANNNAKRDAGELATAVTGGAYSFSNVPVGTYTIRQKLPGGYVQSLPGNGDGISITVTAGSALTQQNFLDAQVRTFITGIGAAAAAQPVYNAGMAPATAWCDARNLGVIRYRNSLGLGDSFHWEFKAPGHYIYSDPKTGAKIDASGTQHGPIAAFVYDKPGSYRPQCTITKPDGTSATYSVTVVVEKDTRTHYWFSSTGSDTNTGTSPGFPLKGGTFGAIATQSNVYLTAMDVVPINLSGTVTLTRNAVIDGPFDVTCKGVGFAGWPSGPHSTQNILIRGMTATSIGKPTTIGSGFTYNASTTNWINIRGNGLSLLNCTVGTLGRAVYVADAGVDGVLLQGVIQPDPKSITSQCVCLFGGGSRMLMLFNNLTGSDRESPVRVETPGSGLSIEHNALSQVMDPPHGVVGGKAAAVIREGRDIWIGNNTVTDGELSVTSGGADPGNPMHSTYTTRITDNVVTSPVATTPPARIRIEAGAIGTTIDHNTIQLPGNSAVLVNPKSDGSYPLQDVVLSSNKLAGILEVRGATSATTFPTGTFHPAPGGPVLILSQLLSDLGFTSGSGSTVYLPTMQPVDEIN